MDTDMMEPVAPDDAPTPGQEDMPEGGADASPITGNEAGGAPTPLGAGT